MLACGIHFDRLTLTQSRLSIEILQPLYSMEGDLIHGPISISRLNLVCHRSGSRFEPDRDGAVAERLEERIFVRFLIGGLLRSIVQDLLPCGTGK
jgi:hypothetical protein